MESDEIGDETMRLGIDIDGVLADFNAGYIERCISVCEKDLFPPRPFDIPIWNYPELFGYTNEEVAKVWRSIETDKNFWLNLEPYWDAMTILERLRHLDDAGHDLYFITSRLGVMAKKQTEGWIYIKLGF